MKEEKKDCLFQYAYDNGVHGGGISASFINIVEDTDLITKTEAEALWNKYYPEVIRRLQDEQRPQMCLWYECSNNSDYGEPKKEIDWRDDLEIVGNKIYKKELTQI